MEKQTIQEISFSLANRSFLSQTFLNLLFSHTNHTDCCLCCTRYTGGVLLCV
jgi:hypothetical protein